jgi:hypothetical protein
MLDVGRSLLTKISASAPELEGIPLPSNCPDCRQQQRLNWRNERHYNHRDCSLCKKKIISMYSTDMPFPVYCYDCFWSDKWDPLNFGREYNFQKSFFEQFEELRNSVPRIALFGKNNVNCNFTNHTLDSKNCYLCVDIVRCEDVFYSRWMVDSRDCADCYQMTQSELCYESLYADNNHNCLYVFLSNECTDSAFLYDCTDCKNCLLCWNLRHKSYCIENVQYSKEEYEQKRKDVDLGSHQQCKKRLQRYKDIMREKAVHKGVRNEQSENCSGSYIYKSKNIQHSFDVVESEDCIHCYDALDTKDSMDAYELGFANELQFNTHGSVGGKRYLSTHICWHCDSLAYCDSCNNSMHCFGCISLKRNERCILNTQYTMEEYEELVPKIIEHMKKTGEWGQFFPAVLSPFYYNESVAQEYYPLTKEKVIEKGFRWKDIVDDVGEVEKVIPPNRLPDHIKDIPDDILNWAIRCEETDRPFRITNQELVFYRKMNLSIPHLHPDERHKRRRALVNPRRLWNRACSKCEKEIQTTYAPERKETVYCEECYLKEVY